MTTVTEQAVETPETIGLSTIKVSALNPRHDGEGGIESLVADIRITGLLQSILLRRCADGSHEVIVGARRFRALIRERGPEGVLHAGEYRIIEWDDERCLRAAFSENKERQDLAPVHEGRFLNHLANQMGKDKQPLSNEQLEAKTGLDRPRISDARALADKVKLLPQSWQKDLTMPPNCRSGDNVITLTHFKHVRKWINGKIDSDVRDLMKEAAKEGWTATKFKERVTELIGKKGKKGTPASGGQDSPERQPDAEPDYEGVLRGLKTAHRHVGRDDETAKLIEQALQRVEGLLAQQKKQVAVATKKTKAA